MIHLCVWFRRFDSIGLVQYNYDDIRSLFTTLVLPTIFIAVLAMQLRYFKPTAPRREADTPAGLPSLVLTSILPIAIMQVIEKPDPSSKGEATDDGGIKDSMIRKGCRWDA